MSRQWLNPKNIVPSHIIVIVHAHRLKTARGDLNWFAVLLNPHPKLALPKIFYCYSENSSFNASQILLTIYTTFKSSKAVFWLKRFTETVIL